MIASSGYVCRVTDDLCAGCENCVNFCQFGALSIINGIASVDAEICMGCGLCTSNCPQEALFISRDPSKGEPLEIHRLIAGANEIK